MQSYKTLNSFCPSNSKPCRLSSTHSVFRNNSKVKSSAPIRYFWKSSIPPKWMEIVPKDQFVQQKDHNGTPRDTLSFLLETQKYINNICKPSPSKIKTIAPRIVSVSSERTIRVRNDPSQPKMKAVREQIGLKKNRLSSLRNNKRFRKLNQTTKLSSFK